MNNFRTEFSELLKTNQAAAIEWLWDHVMNYDAFTPDDFEWCINEFGLMKFVLGQKNTVV